MATPKTAAGVGGPGSCSAIRAGRARRARDRRCARLLRLAAQPERGAAQELPGHWNRDRGQRSARRRQHQPGRNEAVDVLVENGGNADAIAAKSAPVPGVVGAAAPACGGAAATHSSRRSRPSTAPPPGSRPSSTTRTLRSRVPTAHSAGSGGRPRLRSRIYGNFAYLLLFVLILTLILLTRAFRSSCSRSRPCCSTYFRSPRRSGLSSSSFRTATAPRSGTSTRPMRSPPGSR